ncbi:major facilitator superfamily transporter [Variibacter gotjawalensis]|uniref:Major facilitator superfamily transporter n=1 Tax=Variibacter gotjawalensis TaxID=1333996 RepID=A0A0S3PV05_9BRAD|nr:MFS transporter [Variibacter gotjawalensis]NIK50112.1 MFS family permease [Variibacter gotjawalensis]RZS46110.1 putative MFS family arabinose efflux permease [Variibacter gotjawalensis]BAT59785.1 major facilitator superfamily transporter [Variibacter gotjawalensis]
MTSDNPTSAGTPRFLKALMFESFVASLALMSFVSVAGPITKAMGLAPWQLGVAMTASGIGWVLTAPAWGRLSDARGRRGILLFSFAGFALSFILLTLHIDAALRFAMSSMLAFAGLVFCRAAAGTLYAAVPTSNSALVADHFARERRVGAMASIGAANATGMVVGPGLIGVLGVLDLRLPLYVGALLAVIAWVVLWRALPPDVPRTATHKPQSLAWDRRIRTPIVIGFIAMFGVAVAQITVGFLAIDQLKLDAAAATRAASIALAAVGISLVAAQLVLRKLTLTPLRLLGIGCAIGGVGFASAAFATSTVLLATSFAIAAFGLGWVFPSVSAFAANAVEPHEQGAVAGTIASAQGLGTIFGPLVGSAVYAVSPMAPYWMVSAILFVAAAMSLGRQGVRTRTGENR